MRHLLPLLLCAGCQFDLLVVEVQSRESCVADLALEFPGGAAGSVTATLSRTGQEPPSPLAWDLAEGWELTEVELMEVALAPREGVADLHFIDGLQIGVGGQTDYLPLPELTLIDVEQLPTGNSTGTTHLDPTRAHNLVDYLAADVMVLNLDVDGQLPAQRWAIDADVCFALSAALTVRPEDLD